MSLDTLAKLRGKRVAPAALWVVVGQCPDSIKALPDTIAVAENPAAMDWRPIFGLHVDVFDLAGDPRLLDATLGAIDGAFPKAVGVACKEGVIGLSDDHEKAMWGIWRHLANHS